MIGQLISLSQDNTFPRNRRLLKRRDFLRVLKSGARVNDSRLSFAVIENNTGEARLGLAIAKRSIPRAVDRNAIKRQIREAFRLVQDTPGLDIVALTRRSTQAGDLTGIRQSAESLLQRLVLGQHTKAQTDTNRSKQTNSS